MVEIETMRPVDWPAMSAVYREGIATGHATFETQVPSWETWDQAHRVDCRLVACLDGALVGWAALTPVSSRCVYQGVAEVSIYVSAAARGQGVGKLLLQALVAASEAAGIWTLQAGIMRGNDASIALHRACGFREVGYRERLGKLHGEWRDVILMERRSQIAGT